MRKRLLTLLILAAIPLATSGCWFLYPGDSIGGPTTAPSLAPIAGPSEGASDRTCYRGEYRFVPRVSQTTTPEMKDADIQIELKRLISLGATRITQTDTNRGFALFFTAGSGTAQEIRSLLPRTGELDFVAVPVVFAGQVEMGVPLPAGMDTTPLFSVDQISAARPGTDSSGLPAVDVELTSDGARIFDDFAARNFMGSNGGVKFAIVIDGIVQSALGLNTDHFGGEAQIVGQFTDQDVEELVASVESGALPLDVQEVRFDPVSCPAGA